jgi:serine phosphatase RsbU (regulator of sigma subunit)/anti-sigma regulatory factor (Ser/Thr protein kinase)
MIVSVGSSPSPDSDEVRSVERTLAEFQRVTDATLAYLSQDELFAELLNRISEILGSDTAAILLLEENGETLRARAAKGIEEEVEQNVRIPMGRGFAGRIAAERRSITIPDVDHADILNPILRQKGIRSLLGVPLVVEARVLGVLHVGTLTRRTFTDHDAELLQVAGDRVAMAIANAQLEEQRRIVESLQRVLLPSRLPEIPAVELAARYRPAAVGTRVGGDWYDVFPLAGGKVVLTIGDVVGQGVAAAALMAQLRMALRAFALDGLPPATVLDRLNRLLDDIEGPRMTTMTYVVLDPEEETLRVVSAGHVPPILVTPGGGTVVLEVEGDVPLGISRSAVYHEHRFDMPSGSRVVLVTDGAVEVPGEPLEIGLERLREIVSRAIGVEELCDAITTAAGEARTRDDDLAVLAARTVPLADHLRTSWPADAEVLAPLRHLLRRWLRKWGATKDEMYDVTVSVQEACANAVEHAYAPGPAAFDLEATFADGTVTVTISDHGGWRPPRGSNRGRGFPMMEALMDGVDVHRSEAGTRVTLHRRLAGEAAAA